MAGETFQVAQVGFDLQAQAQPVFAPEIAEEVVDLAIELEAIGTLGHRHQDVQADPGVEQGGEVGRRALGQLLGQAGTQLGQAQGAAVEVGAQRVDEVPVFGEGTQDAFGVDHGGDRTRQKRHCTPDARAFDVTPVGPMGRAAFRSAAIRATMPPRIIPPRNSAGS